MVKAASIKANHRIFRVFISSTFSDMKAERNALQKYVFPRLRELALSLNCRFQAIDLRWGVSSEASLDQQTMKICLGEIARCQRTSPRPNFIILLGDRYGWRPLPYDIPSGEFHQILSKVTEEEKALLLTWYRQDLNAQPAVYCLLPREDKYIKYEDWEPEEMRLHALLRQHAENLSLDNTSMQKFSTSATEQEIAAGAIDADNAKEHVIGLFRKIANLDDVMDGLVTKTGETVTGPKAADYVDIRPDGAFDHAAAMAVEALKGKLRTRLPGNIYEYQVRWTSNGLSMDHIGEIPSKLEQCLEINQSGKEPGNVCEAVWLRLSQTIMAEAAKLEAVDPLVKEITIHRKFEEERSASFIGRSDSLRRISEYIMKKDPHPLVVWGQAGSGKSTLIAKTAELASASNGKQIVLYRFIGLTPESSSLRTLLAGLGEQIIREYHGQDFFFAPDSESLVKDFHKSMGLASADEPLILFLDALDQLSPADNARCLAWLPSELPPNVRVIVSTLPGECLQYMEEKTPPENRMTVKELTDEEGKIILAEWLAQVGRKLQPDQEQAVLERFLNCRWPLYLKLIFEEARLWKSYDPVPKLGQDISGLLQAFFDRLSQKSHGEAMVAQSLGYLAAAKHGLAEDEMLDLLSRDVKVYRSFLEASHHLPSDLISALVGYLGPEKCREYRLAGSSPEIESRAETWFYENFHNNKDALDLFLGAVLPMEDGPRLPMIVWSRLFFDLENYLTERHADQTSLLNFFHLTTFKQAIEEKYLQGEEGELLHASLAGYFAQEPLYVGTQDDEAINHRKLSEEPYQLSCAGQWEQLAATVSKIQWILACVKGNRIYSLPQDIQEALGQCSQSEWNVCLQSLYWAIRKETWHFAMNPQPGLIASQLNYHLAGNTDRNSQALLEQMEAEWQAEKIPYLRLLYRPAESQHIILSEHSNTVQFALVTDDGDWGASIDTEGIIFGFNPKAGARLWQDRVSTTVYDDHVLNYDGSHPTYARWAHPAKMALSGGVQPQVWIACFDNATTGDFEYSSKFSCNLTGLDLRTGNCICRKIYQRTFNRDIWEGTIEFRQFAMFASHDGERLVLNGVEGDELKGVGLGLILDARNGCAVQAESERLKRIVEDKQFLAYAGLHAAYHEDGAVVVENLADQKKSYYKASLPTVMAAAFGPNQDQLIIQTSDTRIVTVDGADASPATLFSLPTKIDQWQVCGKWLVCLTGGKLRALNISTGKAWEDIPVQDARQIQPAGQTGLLWLDQDRVLNLNDGSVVKIQKQAYEALLGLVHFPDQDLMGMVCQGTNLVLVNRQELQNPLQLSNTVSRSSKNENCQYSKLIYEKRDTEFVAFNDDLSLVAQMQKDHKVTILERATGRRVIQLQGRDSVCACRFEGADLFIVWGGDWFQVFDWKKGALKYEVRDTRATDKVAPAYSNPILFISRNIWDGIRAVHLPTGITVRTIKLEKEVLRWFYHPRHHKLIIVTSEGQWIWSTRTAWLILGGITSFLFHLAAGILLLQPSRPAGNIAKKSGHWIRPRFGKDERYIDLGGSGIVAGKSAGHWLNKNYNNEKSIYKGSPRKIGSKKSPIMDFYLSRDNGSAVIAEDTGRLARIDLGSGVEAEVYCSFPLEHVWADTAASFIVARDHKNNFYTFEWVEG